MTKKQENELTKMFETKLKEVRFQGLKSGACGILGAVLEMCNDGATVVDIKKFCETSLDLEKRVQIR